jgi:hypothetical protein
MPVFAHGSAMLAQDAATQRALLLFWERQDPRQEALEWEANLRKCRTPTEHSVATDGWSRGQTSPRSILV